MAASKKKTTKKKAPAKKKSAAKKKQQNVSLLRRLFKLGFVVGLWCFIVVALITAWYAAELPALVDNPDFERQNAIIVMDDKGDTVARYGDIEGISITIKDVPPQLVQAVIAIEDRRFYDHFGLDVFGVARAMVTNIQKGRLAQGGSTVTQQLAKNLFLSPERTFKRKIQEALLAIWLERKLSKDEIMAAYLNRVYMGSGAYGIDAAAQVYFKKPAKDLTLYESAQMAGLLKAPSRYSPKSNPSLSASRARVVLSAMEDAGFIPEEERKSQTLMSQVSRRKPFSDPNVSGERYYSDWITGSLDEKIGKPTNDIEIKTTLRTDLQNAAERILHDTLEANKDKNVTQGAIVIMDYTGAVITMIGGRNYSASQFNRAFQALRPPGSSFKPFVYLTALEQGWKPTDEIEDKPLRIGKYRPTNYYNEYHGWVTLDYALTFSLNTVAVRLMRELHPDPVISVARSAGIQAPLDRNLSLALGSSGVPLLEMVTAYATVARNGMYIPPYGIESIKDENGELLYTDSGLHQGGMVLSERATRSLHTMMEHVVEFGTGKAAQLPRRAAGKTGTSQDFRDALFIGFTDQYIAGVWVGNDDNSSMKRVTGGTLPAQIWKQVMLEAHKVQPRRTNYAFSNVRNYNYSNREAPGYTSNNADYEGRTYENTVNLDREFDNRNYGSRRSPESFWRKEDNNNGAQPANDNQEAIEYNSDYEDRTAGFRGMLRRLTE